MDTHSITPQNNHTISHIQTAAGFTDQLWSTQITTTTAVAHDGDGTDHSIRYSSISFLPNTPYVPLTIAIWGIILKRAMSSCRIWRPFRCIPCPNHSFLSPTTSLFTFTFSNNSSHYLVDLMPDCFMHSNTVCHSKHILISFFITTSARNT